MSREGDSKIERWTTATRFGGGGVGVTVVRLDDDLRCDFAFELVVAGVELAELELAEPEPPEPEPPEPEAPELET